MRATDAAPAEATVCAPNSKTLFRARVFLVLGGVLVTIQGVCQEEWGVGLCRDDLFARLFGLSVAIFLTEFVPGLPVLRAFRIESSFNSTLELLRIRFTNCFFVLAQ